MKNLLNYIKQKQQTLFYNILGIIIGIFACFVCLIFIPSSGNGNDVLTQENKTEVNSIEKSYSEAECLQMYNNNIGTWFGETFTPQIEAQINAYYNKCEQSAPRDKYSVLHVIYSKIALDLSKKNDFENATKYYEKALEANLKSNDKLNIGFDYTQIGDCYFNIWQMEKAQKYYKLALPLIPKGPYIYEKLGDTSYNLQQYDKAKEYYQKGLDHVLRLYQDPRMTDTPERRQKLVNYEQKFRSILDGTFDQ